jgi:hypothetical protein
VEAFVSPILSYLHEKVSREKIHPDVVAALIKYHLDEMLKDSQG